MERQPRQYASQDQGQINTDIINTLKRKRVDKKGLITQKIEPIKALITERGSRTKIKFLQETLLQTKSEVLDIHEELMVQLKEGNEQYGFEWMEEINFEVNDCCNDANDYLISRRDNPPSETISKASIVDGNFNRSVHDESLTEGISDLANQLNNMSLKMSQNSEKQEISDNLLGREIHTKADIPEILESITLNSGFNQERNARSNQSQIHNSLNTRNRDQLQQEK